MLGPDDPLPRAPRRVLVAGASGSGKTTLARRIAGALDLSRVELDALYHGTGWTPRPQFLADVEAFTAGDAWVCEWQYDAARPLLAERAELLVWLDLPVAVAMTRVVRRSVRRRLRREELWNGNREAPLRTVLSDPDHVLRWAWRTRHLLRRLVPDLERTHPHLTVVRLRRRGDAHHFVKSLTHFGTA